MRTFILEDNQDITRIGIERLVDSNFKCNQMLRAGSFNSLVELLRSHPESVVVIDYTLFDFQSPDQLLNLKASTPDSSWILFSDELSVSFIRTVLLSYHRLSLIFKNDSEQEIANALQSAFSNESYICTYANKVLADEEMKENNKEKLTPSERNILRQIAEGKSTKEIAYSMHLSFHTINTHRKNIFRKIEVNNVHEAIRYAVRSGLADMNDYYI